MPLSFQFFPVLAESCIFPSILSLKKNSASFSLVFSCAVKVDHLIFQPNSRPDLLDAALLRPGRLDRLLFCDFPSEKERRDILTVLSRKVS